MRIAMMGSGGLGAFVGGLLAHAGENVTSIARGANLAALHERGLTVKRLPGPTSSAETFHLDVQATHDPAKVGPVDLVWFCVKTYDLDAAARQAAPMVGPKTLILPIQNGADASEQIAVALGAGIVLGGVALGGATLTAPGVVEQKTARVPLKFGELDGRVTDRADHLHQVLVRAGIEAVLSENIVREIWEKLIFSHCTSRIPLLWAVAPARRPAGCLRVRDGGCAVAGPGTSIVTACAGVVLSPTPTLA